MTTIDLANLLDADLLAALDRFIDHRDEPPHGRMSRAEALNTLARDWLMGQGYLELPDGQGQITRALDAALVPQETSRRDREP